MSCNATRRASVSSAGDGLVLEAQALPDPSDWERAVRLANAVFGIQASPLMNAQNVAELAEGLRRAANEHREAASALVEGSTRAAGGARHSYASASDRLRTAEATHSLLSALDRAGEDELVGALAEMNVKTGDDVAMGESLERARLATAALDSGEWEVFETLDGLAEPHQERAREIATTLDDALRQNEHVTPLADTRRRCQKRALALLREIAVAQSTPAPPPQPPPLPPERKDAPGKATGHRTVAAAEVTAVFADIENAIQETAASRVEIEWKVFTDEDIPEGKS